MPPSVRTGACLFAAILFFAVAGCGGNSFVGKHYDNFTSYYNTFYNAEQDYKNGVQAMESSEQPVDRTQYLGIFGGPPRAGGNVNFQNAIERSANVLRDHPRSKWVDDALILIGKSYFYQQNYVGAEQKFREVIAFETSLEDDARIWLARTLMAARAYESAQEHLASSLDRENMSRRSVARLRLALGELSVKQGDFETAATELEAALPDVRSNDLQAKGAFLLGQVYETLERYEEAVEAYRRVLKARPPYELDYAASLSAVRVQGIHLDGVAALETLRRMDRDDKHYDRRFELAYVRGRIYHAQEQPQDALAMYRHILYEGESTGQAIRGLTHYALAELYRDVFTDYLLAAAHFDTARTAIPSSSSGSGQSVQHAPEAVTDAADQAEVFASFANVRTTIAHMDSLLALGRLSDEAFDERILALQQQKAEELAEERRRAEQLQAERGFQDAASRTGVQGAGGGSDAANAGEAGFLSHRDRTRVQEARLNFVARWGERPHVPNWRRTEAVSIALSEAEHPDSREGAASAGDGDGIGMYALPLIDISEVPRDSLSQAIMEEERALSRYELGNVLFLSMNEPDSAAVWYRMVIEKNADTEVAQRAFYALAEVQRSLGDLASAQGIYRQVLSDYPDSDFAARVRIELGLEPVETLDSLAVALEEYDEAAMRWRRGAYEEAMNRMVLIASRYRNTEVAPRALFAAGRIYFEWAASDSLDVFGPLPIELSDSVLAQAGILALAPASSSSADTLLAEEQEANTGFPPEDSEEYATPDTMVVAPPASDIAPESDLLASADTDIIDLRSVYTGVRTLYPSTTYADRAEYILDMLDRELQALHAPVDSVASDTLSGLSVPDSLAGSSLPDSLAGEQANNLPAVSDEVFLPFDETHVPPDEASLPPGEESLLSDEMVLPAIPSGEFSLYGGGGIRPELGGFTIVLGAHTDREPMEMLVAPYAQQGLRAAVVSGSVDDRIVYRAALGHFSDEEAAGAALQGLGYMLRGLAEPPRVQPLTLP